MLIVMHHAATDKDIEKVKSTIRSMGLKPVAIPGAERTAIGIIGNQSWIDDGPIRTLKGILEIIHVTKPYKLVSRDFITVNLQIQIPFPPTPDRSGGHGK